MNSALPAVELRAKLFNNNLTMFIILTVQSFASKTDSSQGD